MFLSPRSDCYRAERIKGVSPLSFSPFDTLEAEVISARSETRHDMLAWRVRKMSHFVCIALCRGGEIYYIQNGFDFVGSGFFFCQFIHMVVFVIQLSVTLMWKKSIAVFITTSSKTHYVNKMGLFCTQCQFL